MRPAFVIAGGLAAWFALGHAASAQMLPTVVALPGPNKSYEAFQRDDAYCQGTANNQVAKMQDQAGNQVVGNAIVGGLLGAGIGAAVGGPRGAAFGAGAGAASGTATGVANAQGAMQQRFDTVYMQCMVGHGNRINGDDSSGNDNDNNGNDNSGNDDGGNNNRHNSNRNSDKDDSSDN
jgi:outer membrane lipoprotein SlyB